MTIDYDKIAGAIEFYKAKGYVYADVPWLVAKQSMLVTAPPDRRLFSTFAGELVASGEQSFIEIRKHLLSGRYCCATPCFRDESLPDELHLQYFFKVELIDVSPKNIEYSIERMIGDAKEFFSEFLDVEVVKTDIGQDIFGNKMELGSYGNRTYQDFNWTYGTGCAEPRLSQACE